MLEDDGRTKSLLIGILYVSLHTKLILNVVLTYKYIRKCMYIRDIGNQCSAFLNCTYGDVSKYIYCTYIEIEI